MVSGSTGLILVKMLLETLLLKLRLLMLQRTSNDVRNVIKEFRCNSKFEGKFHPRMMESLNRGVRSNDLSTFLVGETEIKSGCFF